jgi:ankyrin repeat protein
MLTEAQRQYMLIERALRAGDFLGVRAAFNDDAAFPNVRDPLTWTHLLALAISWSPVSLIGQLLDVGADPKFDAPDGFPAIYGAMSANRPDGEAVVELLLARGADPNARGINDYTPLHLAVSNRDERAMRLLLAHGADPALRTRIDDCATPLEEAEAMGNDDGANMLRRLLT